MKLIYWLALFAGLVTRLQAQIAPTIASVSPSQTLIQGQSLSLSVSVNGSAPFTYQWKKNGAAISGATSSTYAFVALTLADAASYTVIVSNGSGAASSGVILIDVTPAVPPSLGSYPGNVAYSVGDTISLFASAYGSDPLTFVWKRDGTTVATTSSYYYTKTNAQASDSGTYTVTVSNGGGSVSTPPFTVTVSALTAPLFNVQPSSAIIPQGGSAWLQSGLANYSGVTFQWYLNGVVISNATNPTYLAQLAGSYTVKATNTVGTTTSSVAIVTVVPSGFPIVTIPNGPINVTVDTEFSLFGSVNGTGPISYQWRKDGIDIPGANSSFYERWAANVDDTGTYTLVANNSQGSAVSNATYVSVAGAIAPIITSQPMSWTAYPGTFIGLYVNATGTGSLNFQWKRNGVAIGGANSSYYYINSAASADAGVYTVVVSSVYGSTTSLPATVSVLAEIAPVITSQPVGTEVIAGQSISLSVSATGYPYPTFQWKKDGVAIPGATNNYYTQSGAASSDSGNYTVVVNNSAGSITSDVAAVGVLALTAPVITNHPASASLLPGSTFWDLSVASLFSNQSSVKWYLNDVEITGATDATYGIQSAQPSQAGTYKAVVTNSAGATTTYTAMITVDLSAARPVITYASGSQAVAGGSNASPRIEVAPGIGTYSVQWKKNGAAIPNAYSLTLYLANFDLTMTGVYTAEVTTKTGVYTSRPIVLDLLNSSAAPRILQQPMSASRAAGTGNFGLSIQADGLTPLTYQWRKNGVDIPGATSAVYSFGNITVAHAGEYTVVVTNANGSVTSAAATLVVTTPATAPIIASQPASQTLTGNYQSLTLNVGLLDAFGNETFQWYKDGVPVPGAISAYFYGYGSYSEIPGHYKVVVTNSAGSSTSDEAIVSIVPPPTAPSFSAQPAGRTGYIGDHATFSALATGSPTITYQWRKNGVAIPGATGSMLTLNNLQVGDAGTYSVLATNTAGTTVSSNAVLTVGARLEAGDFNGDGKADIFWTNRVTGARALWLMNGAMVNSNAFLGTVSVQWIVSGTGDFNNDGKTDILWTNTATGDRVVWLMDGNTKLAAAYLGTIPLAWEVSGIGDFNGDGKDDIVWTNSLTGERSIWLMNGTAVGGGASLGTVPIAWSISGVADFNGDGNADILWTNTATGDRAMWLMNGTAMSTDTFLGTVPVEWDVSGFGDFNGDGKADILWSNGITGDRAVWLMNGATSTDGGYLGMVSLDWEMTGTGDFDGDGKDDILWTNMATGERALWLMNGIAASGGASLGVVSIEWSIAN